ncbi:hypothetical protein BDL97_05G048900 [Sphagnum fallax]|nr:hypothetical protein BDL97_05G048900 [Sphagnum fallax]KAH8961407.1 hypothetical protein BDL97_05G048900 [Sphagnum fallax]
MDMEEQQAFTTVGGKEEASLGVSAQGYQQQCREFGLQTMRVATVERIEKGEGGSSGDGDDAGKMSKAHELEEDLGYAEKGYVVDGQKQPTEGSEPSSCSKNLAGQDLADSLQPVRSFMTAAATVDQQTKKEVKVSAFLIGQLRSLAAKERELEARIGRERVEHVVEKVEDEVEYEGAMEEMWLNMQADEESRQMEQRERDFEVERREVQLEDEIVLLRGRVQRLEEELKLAHVEKEYALQKKQDEMDGIIQGMLVELQASEDREELSIEQENLRKLGDSLVAAAAKSRQAAVSPSKAIFLAFEDTLKKADQQVEQARNILDSTLRAKEDAETTFQQQQCMWHERELQLESQILELHKELSKISGLMREADSGLFIEQERRKEARHEVEDLLIMYRDEKKMRSESEEKLKRLVKFLVKMKENLVKDNHGDDDLQGRFRALLQELEKELQRANSKRSSSNEKRSQVLESEQANQWKTQRDAAETERDKLETKLKLQLKRARDREQEIEAMWSEREKDLVARCSHLESGLAQWEAKYKTRGAEIMKEQKARKQEMEIYCKEWADEKASWEAMVSQREDWLEEQVAKWTSLLDAKDYELFKLKHSYHELNRVATATKERLDELQQQLYENTRAFSEHSTQTSLLCEKSQEESEGESCLSIVKFVNETDMMEEESTKMEMEKLRAAKNELEMKVQDTLHLVEALQSEFSAKERQMELERTKLELILATKAADMEQLQGQLSAREHEMEVLMQKFQDEVLNIDREVERERKEREEVMEMHFVGKRRLVNDMREKEERWQNEMDAIAQELAEQRVSARQKDEDVATLKENLKTLEEHQRTEDLKVAKLLASFRQENDALTNELDQQRKAGKLANADVQKLQKEIETLLEELDAERQKKMGLNMNQGNLNDWRTQLQASAGQVVVSVGRQMSDATCIATESLREELCVKEMQLVMTRKEQEEADLGGKGETILGQELSMQEEEHCQQEWQCKEQKHVDKENILQELEAEREEVSVLQGTVRELEWLLMHSEVENKNKLDFVRKKEGMVKVHSSHLEEVDQYIMDLRSKLEESETKRKGAEVALAVQDLKRAASLDAATLVQVPNKHDGRPLAYSLSLDNRNDSLCVRTRASFDAGVRSGHFSVPGVQDHSWELGNPSGSFGLRNSIASVAGSGTWLAQCDDTMQRNSEWFGLPVTSPGQRRQKWLIDAAWLERVRKEQAFLRQQLDVERQRVSALAQVETENRLIEAAVTRAVEEKQQSEATVLGLQQEVSRLQKIVTSKSGVCS